MIKRGGLEEAIKLTERIIAKAENALTPIDREMKIMKWDAEYQKIMWEAVMASVKIRLARLK